MDPDDLKLKAIQSSTTHDFAVVCSLLRIGDLLEGILVELQAKGTQRG